MAQRLGNIRLPILRVTPCATETNGPPWNPDRAHFLRVEREWRLNPCNASSGTLMRRNPPVGSGTVCGARFRRAWYLSGTLETCPTNSTTTSLFPLAVPGGSWDHRRLHEFSLRSNKPGERK